MTRADAQKNRTHLLTVARSIAEVSGSAPSFNELAKQAGVGVGTVYRHFEDEYALLAGLAEELLVGLGALLAEADAEKDPWSAFELLLRGAVTLGMKSPVLAALLASPERVPPAVIQQLGALQKTADRVVARGRKAKVLHPSVKADDMRRLVCGVDHAARSGDAPFEAAKRYVDILLLGCAHASIPPREHRVRASQSDPSTKRA